jgi:hypothetical protein
MFSMPYIGLFTLNTTLVLSMQESCDPTHTVVHCAGGMVCEYEIYFFIVFLPHSLAQSLALY